MTATQVDGRLVIADEPAESPLSAVLGKRVSFPQIRQLLLDDETVIYGCKHCDYTTDSPARVRTHLKVHRPTRAEKSTATVDDVLGRLREAIDRQHEGLLTAVERLSADRDDWKARALKAEKALDTLRKALNP